MTNKPPRPPSLSQYRPSDDRPGNHPQAQPPAHNQAPAHGQGYGQPGQPGTHPGLQTPAGGHPGHPGQPPQGAPRPQRRHGNPPPKPPTSGFGVGTFLLYAVVAIVAVVAAGLTFLIISPPTDLIRSQAIKAVKEHTGRDLTISGETSISFYPSIGISMGDVTLGAPPGMGGAPLAKIAKLTVAVQLFPLLSSEVVVDTLILERPQFDLRVDGQGRKSWDFASVSLRDGTRKLTRVAQVRLAQTGGGGAGAGTTANDGIPPEAREFLENSTGWRSAQPGNAKAKGTDIAALEQLRLGDVRIIDGAIRYTDAREKVSERVDDINVSLDLTSIGAPFTASGDLAWKGEKIDFDATLTSLKLLMQKRPAKVEAKISARPVRAVFDGTIDIADEFGLDGAINANAKSLRALALWLGTKLPKVEGFGPLTIQGRLKAKGSTYSILNAKVGLDGALATGQVSVATAGVRPFVRAKLKLSVLDLNKYMLEDGVARSGRGDASGKKSTRPAKGGGATKPQVRGYSKRAGWSRDPIDLSSLGAVDADAQLIVGKLLFKKIKVDSARLDVKLKSSVLRANLTEMRLYKGSGRGVVTLNASNAKSAVIGANFAVDNVAVQPLLKDAADIEWLSGTGRLTMAINSRGRNQLNIVKALAGKLTFNFVDGAVSGFNLPQMIRSFSDGQISGVNQSATQKTDFSEFVATFDIKNGIASNTDLRMSSPLLRVTGAGKIFLPKQRVDYTVKPKLVSELEGQGGGQGLAGLVIPVRIHGPFDKLSYSPDFGGILSNPDQAIGLVKKLGDQFKGKKTKDILDGLLGGILGDQNGQGQGAGGDGAALNPETPPDSSKKKTAKKKKKKKKSAQKILDDLLGGGDSSNGDDGGQGGKVDAKKLLDGLFGN